MATSKQRNGSVVYRAEVLKVMTLAWTKLKESDLSAERKKDLQYFDNYIQKQVRALADAGKSSAKAEPKQSSVLTQILS